MFTQYGFTATEIKLAKQCQRDIIGNRAVDCLPDEDIWNAIAEWDLANDYALAGDLMEAIFEHVRKVVNS